MIRRFVRRATARWIGGVAASLLASILCGASAQTPGAKWPTRPLKLVVPYGAGSQPDVFARIVSDRLQQRLGQPIVIENRPGADGDLGTAMVAKTFGDGYTFLVGTNGALTYHVDLHRRLGYDPFTDLRPVVLGAGQPNVCVVRADWGIGSLRELAAAMKARPGKLSYASAGEGSLSHLAIELLKARTGTFAVHVPYPSPSQAILAILQGSAHFACVPAVTVIPQLRAGTLRALAVSTGFRSALTPQIPTMEEAGVSGVSNLAWMAFMAPASTPGTVVERLNAEINTVLATPDVRQKLLTQYIEPIGGSIDELREFLRKEREVMAPIIRRSGAIVD